MNKRQVKNTKLLIKTIKEMTSDPNFNQGDFDSLGWCIVGKYLEIRKPRSFWMWLVYPNPYDMRLHFNSDFKKEFGFSPLGDSLCVTGGRHSRSLEDRLKYCEQQIKIGEGK